MSDFNSSLPVRTETNGDVAAKIVDGTITSQALAVDASGKITTKLDDAAGNGITSQTNGAQRALDVGIDVAGVQIDPRQIRALTAADVVTANQGTSPWVTKDQADGPVAPGTVATYSSLAGGQYNATPPTLTDTQQAALQVDANGRLLVDAKTNNDTNYGVVGANTLRTAAQIGNATGAADFNAGATGAQTLRVAANQGAPNTNANGWFVRVTDGTNNQSVTASGAAHVTADNFPTTVDTNYGVVGANTIRTASQIGNATGAADFNNGATGAQTLRVAANLAIGGADVTTLNPVPVVFEAGGTTVCDYKNATAVAAGANDNHDYTVTAGKTLHLTQVESSASGKAKMILSIETGVATGVFNIKFVQYNSTADADMSLELMTPILVAAGVRVRCNMTNKDLAAEDLHSTICGYEI
jgi:hypothetical protein